MVCFFVMVGWRVSGFDLLRGGAGVWHSTGGLCTGRVVFKVVLTANILVSRGRRWALLHFGRSGLLIRGGRESIFAGGAGVRSSSKQLAVGSVQFEADYSWWAGTREVDFEA